MYEDQNFEVIMKRLLDRVPNDVDKREGSIIYDALAPAAAELAQIYVKLATNENLSYADTSSGEYLRRRTAEYGVNPDPATKAKRKGLFFNSQGEPIDLPIQSRFSLNDLNYVVIEKIDTGQFVLECETEGVIGNQQFGNIIPIEYIEGLARAELTDVLVPGEDEETDDSLRDKYLTAINEQPFGGNIDDYKKKVGGIPGVGGVKVFPTWKGGGTVKCVIQDSNFSAPSPELVDKIQTAIDPVENSGKGMGFAPIGHRVTLCGVTNSIVVVSTLLSLEAGVTFGQVQPTIEQAINGYLLDLRKSWKKSERLIVRISQIEARILAVNGVVDVTNTKINTGGTNLELGPEEIPQLGVITLGAT